MNPAPPPSSFRRALARELPAWRADGIVDDDGYARLSARYRLDRAGGPSTRWTVHAFAVLGGLCVGAGVLSFVAAHWTAIDPAMRFALVIAVAAAAQAFGIALRGRAQLYGEALLVLGGIAAGGAIALGAQEFNAPVSVGQVYGLWALALLAPALVLRSTALSVLALVAGLFAYGSLILDLNPFGDTVRLAVLAAGAGALAVRLRQRWFSEVVGVVVAIAFVVHAAVVALTSIVHNVVGAMAILTPAMLAAVFLVAQTSRVRPLIVLASVAAILEAFAFTFWAPHLGADAWTLLTLALGDPFWALPVGAVVVAAVALGRRRDRLTAAAGAAVALVVLTGFALPPLAGVLIAHALLLVPAGVLLMRGLRDGDRAAFLAGAAIPAVLVIARFAEYDHDLNAKAAAFVIVGLLFAGCAMLFERRLSAEVAVAT